MSSITRRNFVAGAAGTSAALWLAQRSFAASRPGADLFGSGTPAPGGSGTTAGVDSPLRHRCRRQQGDRKLRVHDGLAARCGVSARRENADRQAPRHFRHVGRRRKAHPRHLFHVRRQAGRGTGMVGAAVGGPPGRHARCRHGRDGSRRSESERPGIFFPRRVACDPRRQAQAAGEPGTGRGRRGGDRLAAYSTARPCARRCAPRSRNATAC